jgi:hypothetical protein
MGNHEQLLLDIIFKKIPYKDGLKHFHRNGGRKTVESFKCPDFKTLAKKINGKYLDFLINLKYSYSIYDINDALPLVIFIHGGLVSKVSLEDQLSVNSIDDYHLFIKKNKLRYEDTFLWVREEFYKNDADLWNNRLVIHGHTPVHLMEQFFTRPPHINFTPKKYFNPSYFEYASFNDSRPFFRLKKIHHRPVVVSVNIDTGCGSGKKLSAIGLDLSHIKDNKIPTKIVQVDLNNSSISEQSTYISL